MYHELRGLSFSSGYSQNRAKEALKLVEQTLSLKNELEADFRVITNTGNYMRSLEYANEKWDMVKIRETMGKDQVSADDVIIMCCIYATENRIKPESRVFLVSEDVNIRLCARACGVISIGLKHL